MFKRQAYYIACAAFVIFSLVYFVAIINQSYVGLTLKNSNGLWIVTASDPHGEGFKLGVRVGDSILKINDRATGEYRYIKKWGEAEGATTIESRRIGQPINTINKISERPSLMMVLSEMPLVILGFVFWIMGFITWFKRPFLVQARALFWLNWLLGLAIVLAPASSRDLMFARELEYITLSAVPILLINFVSVFPIMNKNRINRFGRVIVTFMFVIILSLAVLHAGDIINSFNILRKLVLLTMIIGVLLALWNLVVLIKLPKDRPEKNQAIIMLFGMAIGFLPIVLLTAVPILLNFQPIVNAQVSYLFIAAIPVTWYYVIVHKYLPDSRRLLGTTIAFFIAGFMISLVVSYVLFMLNVSTTLSLEVYLASLSLTMSLLVCFRFVQLMISKLLNRFAFFEGEQNFTQRVLKLNENLTSINEVDRIFEEVVSLTIEGAFIVVEDSKGGYLKKAVGRFLDKPSEQAELEKFFQADQRVNLDVKMLPDDFPAEVYIPFTSNDFTCGIFLGHRYSHVKFKLDELPLITLISSQLAQRLITAFVIKELSTEIKDLAQRASESQRRSQGLQGITTSLFRSVENEKKVISREIHDGPLQLGLDLNRWLKYLVEEGPAQDDEKRIQAITHMGELVENLNFELRLICNDLRPPSLTDLGLISAIELLCEETMLKELLLISLETVGISREKRFKEEVELAAYRFIQEGISNTVRHSGSKKLKIHIAMHESSIEITVRDTGRGFDISKIDDWSLTSAHFGIVGMKERLENLGGVLQISSTISKGTMLKAVLPIE